MKVKSPEERLMNENRNLDSLQYQVSNKTAKWFNQIYGVCLIVYKIRQMHYKLWTRKLRNIKSICALSEMPWFVLINYSGEVPSLTPL